MIQFMRGTKSQLTSNSSIIAAGQPVFEIDTGQLKIGNGSSVFSALPYVGVSSSGPTITTQGSAKYLQLADNIIQVSGEFYVDLSGQSFSPEWSSSTIYKTHYIIYDASSTLNQHLSSLGLSVKSKIFNSFAQHWAYTSDIVSFSQAISLSVSSGQLSCTLIVFWLPTDRDPPTLTTCKVMYSYIMYD